VGTIGLTNAAAGIKAYSIPVVGEGVALYSWCVLWYELGADYGPGTWFDK
jgi:hypothetical protein